MEAVMGPDRYQWDSVSHEDKVKEAAMAVIRFYTQQGVGNRPQKMCIAPQLDPYARASVASVPRPIIPVMIRQLQAEPTLQSKAPESSRVARKPVMKRKVLRRRPNGEVQVTDESIISEPESSSPSDPEYGDLSHRMYGLNTQQDEEDSEEEEEEEEGEPNSCVESVISYSWRTTESQSQGSQRESRSRGSASYEQDLILAGHPKSFILPRLEQLSRNKLKTDRVARYLEHKHDWETLRLPGEDLRKGVRWNIREQMLYKTEFPPRPPHIYMPNNYLVPTEKKRSALRWGIRCDLANGVIPRSSNSS